MTGLDIADEDAAAHAEAAREAIDARLREKPGLEQAEFSLAVETMFARGLPCPAAHHRLSASLRTAASDLSAGARTWRNS